MYKSINKVKIEIIALLHEGRKLKINYDYHQTKSSTYTSLI